MIDRRRFLKLFSGGIAVAAHAGVPSLLVRPAARFCLGMDNTAAAVLRPVEARTFSDPAVVEALMSILAPAHAAAYRAYVSMVERSRK